MSMMTAHLKMPEKDDHMTSQVHWECVSCCKLFLLTFIVYTVYLTGLRTEVIYPESSTTMMSQWNVSLHHEVMLLSTFVGSHFVSLIYDCRFFFCPFVCFWIYPHPHIHIDVQTQILNIIRTHMVLMLHTLMRLSVSTGATPVIFFKRRRATTILIQNMIGFSHLLISSFQSWDKASAISSTWLFALSFSVFMDVS